MEAGEQKTMNPPTYPARPINGGPLPRALPKRGRWTYEPKVNGWRALVHVPTGAMWNRHGERLSIEREFAPVLERLREWWHSLEPWQRQSTETRYCVAESAEWLDCEALERRLSVGKGSLVILDLPMNRGDYGTRMGALYECFIETGVAQAWGHEQFPPPSGALLSFAYTYDDGDHEMLPSFAWERLQEVNRAFGCELFEGLVAKRLDSKYPVQLRSATEEFAGWMKHRWRF